MEKDFLFRIFDAESIIERIGLSIFFGTLSALLEILMRLHMLAKLHMYLVDDVFRTASSLTVIGSIASFISLTWFAKRSRSRRVVTALGAFVVFYVICALIYAIDFPFEKSLSGVLASIIFYFQPVVWICIALIPAFSFEAIRIRRRER